MPVEIRELVIRAVAARAANDDEEPQESDAAPRRSDPAEDRAAIVEECVRQVLRILQQKKAR
jgi:hypothetical protein